TFWTLEIFLSKRRNFTSQYVLIKRNHFRGLSLSIVKLCSKQILPGLALLKDDEIIHCDLKPENILLCTRGIFHMPYKPPLETLHVVSGFTHQHGSTVQVAPQRCLEN
ncbi:Serine/threonine protein kinase, partial [Parasponia andersonii]